ncbi:MAG: universal stress protein [Nocardioides sp.]
MSNPWILVGVDGSEAGRQAVRYAGKVADRLGADIRVVHVMVDLPLLPGMAPVADPSWVDSARTLGEQFLADAVAVATQTLSADRVGTTLLSGDRISAISEAAEGATTIVLGDERRSLLDRLVVGSVIAGVASRATVPVVAVPDRWDPETSFDTVTVGVKDLDKAGPLVHAAAGVAADRKARLVVLHAWHLPAAYDDLMVSAMDRAEFRQAAGQAMKPLLEAVTAAHPGLSAELVVVNGQPAAALVEASKNTDLIVLARRTRRFPMGYLGTTGRALLRASACPVAVLPPDVTHAENGAPPTA